MQHIALECTHSALTSAHINQSGVHTQCSNECRQSATMSALSQYCQECTQIQPGPTPVGPAAEPFNNPTIEYCTYMCKERGSRHIIVQALDAHRKAGATLRFLGACDPLGAEWSSWTLRVASNRDTAGTVRSGADLTRATESR